QSVVVDIAEGDAKAFARRIGDAGLHRDVGEGAVAVVAEEPVGYAVEDRRAAVGAEPFALEATVRVVVVADVEVVRHVDVEAAVAVEVEEADAARPLVGPAGDAGPRGDV